MKQTKPFIFMGNSYFEYQKLAKAMAENWNDAVIEINNGVSLTYFADNDPAIYGKMQVEIQRCKYADNVLTAFLYYIAPNLGICIKGRFFVSLVQMAEVMEENYAKIIPGIQAFIEDKCISHLFMDDLMENYKNKMMISLIPTIESNIEDSFAYYYFFKLFTDKKNTRKNKELDPFLSVFGSQTNSIQTVYNITRRDDFLYSLSKYIGFDRTLAYKKNPDFLLGLYDNAQPYTSVDLKPLMYCGYHIYMLANFKNYSYKKGIAKDIYGQYVKLSSRYAKGKDLDIDFARKAYDLYLRFVAAYQAGDIITSNVVYSLDKVSCNTVVCSSYDATAVSAPVTPRTVSSNPKITLPTKELASNVAAVEEDLDEIFDEKQPDFTQLESIVRSTQNLNPTPPGAPIPTVVNGADLPPVSQVPEFETEGESAKEEIQEENVPLTDAAKKMKKFKNAYGRKTRFALFGLLLGLWFVIEYVLSIVVRKDVIINKGFDIAIVSCGGLVILAALILLTHNFKSKKLSNKYYDEQGNRTKLGQELTKLERRKVRSKIYYSFRSWSSVILVLSSFSLICILKFYLFPILEKMNIEAINDALTNSWNVYYVLIAPVLGIVLCIIKKKKTIPYLIFAFILEIVVIAAAVGIASLF